MPPTLESLWTYPALRPLSPIVVAAWQDDHLSPAELLFVRETLERNPFLDTRAREALSLWLDPSSPPPPRALKALDQRMRDYLRGLPSGQRHSLLGMGAALANGHLPSPSATGSLGALATIAATAPMFYLGSPRMSARAEVAGTRGRRSDSDEPPPDVEAIRARLDGPAASSRARVRDLLDRDARFRLSRGLSTEDQRAQVLLWLHALIEAGLVEHCYPGGPLAGRDLERFAAVFETLAMFDLSLVVKFGVQAGLFAGAIETLGTERHHGQLAAALRGELLGCFAMTERGHGSNVRALQTTATYVAEREEFVIHTGRLSAGKEWIGNAARDGRAAVVFAQLHVDGEEHGLHAFIVPIRDDSGQACEGVRIEDCGAKMGLNGVDNGRLWFDKVRVPRAALLDRFGQIAGDGTYHSDIPSPGRRFFAMLNTLVGGRIAVSGAATTAAKVGLSIAIRYGHARTQFPDDEGREAPIMDYASHRSRLLPRLASAYAYTFAQEALVQAATLQADATASVKGTGEQAYDVETLAAGIKSLATWHSIDTLQQCRECCGGQGYLSVNRIDALRTDSDVFATFEGDNTVLLSLVARNLLRETQRDLSQRPVSTLFGAVRERAAEILRYDLPGADPAETTIAKLETQRALLALREQRLRSSLMVRMFALTRRGLGAQAAFDRCQAHALDLARAYTERFVLDRFAEAAAKQPALLPLCNLYGLWRISEDLTYFLGEGVVSRDAVREVRAQLERAIKIVAEHALDWVDAFAIPSACLGPLADANYVEASGLAGDSVPEPDPARDAVE